MIDRYRLDGHTPVPEPDLLAWGRWLETAERHVGDTTLPNGARISTVFLGLDHQFGDGPPLLFETMVFGGAFDQEIQRRYSTWEEAEAGHAVAVDEMKSVN